MKRQETISVNILTLYKLFVYGGSWANISI